MIKKTLPRFTPNHNKNKIYDRHENILFLNLESFSYYWSAFDPEEIKPLNFGEGSDKELCQGLGTKKSLPTVTDLD